MEAAKDRPPYVTFIKRAVEDRSEYTEGASPKMVDVDYVYITPAGSKDRVERVAKEWLAHLRDMVQQDRFPAAWYENFKTMYRLWGEDQEPPVNGTALDSCGLFTPAQVKNCQAWQVKTVEDLAVANEETLKRIGMGARAMKDKAEAFVTNRGSDLAKLTNRLDALERDNEALKARNIQLEEDKKELEQKVKSK